MMRSRSDANYGLSQSVTSHGTVDKHVTMEDAENSRQGSLMNYASQCCECPLPSGSACGGCTSCCLILQCKTQKDGLHDDWKQYFCDMPCVRLRCADYGFLYNYNPPLVVPPVVGPDYTPGVSQVAIFTPSSNSNPMFGGAPAQLNIITLTSPTAADFPTAASLAVGEFAIYGPKGFGLGNPSSSGVTFALGGVLLANIAVYSNSYASLNDVPSYLINTMYVVTGSSTATGVVLAARSIAMYDEGWLLQVKYFLDSSPELAGPRILRIDSVNDARNFWSLSDTGSLAIYDVQKIYIKGIVEFSGKCNSCSVGKGGCGGHKCGNVQHKAVYGNGHHDFEQEESNETQMLSRVLQHDSHQYHGLTVHPETYQVVSSMTGDNLAYCPKSVLVEALRRSKRADKMVKVHPNWNVADLMDTDSSAIQATVLEQKARWAAALGRAINQTPAAAPVVVGPSQRVSTPGYNRRI